MGEALSIAVFGAGGTTGTLLLEQAIRGGHHVRGPEHHLPDDDDRIAGVEYVRCDVLEDDLDDLVSGCDAVVSTLGVAFSPSTAIDPPPLYAEGTRRIVEAMGRVGIDRLAVISAAFVEHQPAAPAWFSLTAVPALNRILDQMRAMEGMLEAQDWLRWTAVRPGWLLDLPYSAEVRVRADRLPEECFRCRQADLAAFLLEVVVEDNWVGARPAIGKPETDDIEGLAALRDEIERMFAG